jgi:hypothetical protein
MRTAELRELLKSAFGDEELTAFCYDYFSPVHEMFSSGMGRLVKIQLLIEYCEKQGKFKDLLSLLEQKNPYQYNKVYFASQEDQQVAPANKTASQGASRTEVQIVLKGSLIDFTPELQGAAIRALAAVLNIPHDQVRLLSVSSGSVILKVEIDKRASERLLQLYAAQDPVIQDLGIQEVTTPTRTVSLSRKLIIGSLVAALTFIVALISLVRGASTLIDPLPTARTVPTAAPAAAAPASTNTGATAPPQTAAAVPQQSGLACSAIAGLPVFADATCIDHDSGVEDGMAKLHNTYTTPASTDEVRRFYEAAFAEQGWSTNAFTNTIELDQRRATIEVDIVQRPSGLFTRVRLTEYDASGASRTTCAPIAGLPVVPNATCIQFALDRDDGVLTVENTYSTAVSPDDVRRFYQQQLSSNTWASQEATFDVSQSGRRAQIGIKTQQAPGGNLTEFRLSER